MAFRKNSDETDAWRRWRQRNRQHLIDASIPEWLLADQGRWLMFLEHTGWDAETGYTVDMLSPQQARALAELLRNDPGLASDLKFLLHRLDALSGRPSDLPLTKPAPPF